MVLLRHPLPLVKTQTIGDHYHHRSHPHATAGSRQAYRTAELSVVITSYLHPFVVGGAAAALYLPYCLPRERMSARWRDGEGRDVRSKWVCESGRKREREREQGLKFSGALLPGNITQPAASSHWERATRVIPHLSPFSLKPLPLLSSHLFSSLRRARLFYAPSMSEKRQMRNNEDKSRLNEHAAVRESRVSGEAT